MNNEVLRNGGISHHVYFETKNLNLSSLFDIVQDLLRYLDHALESPSKESDVEILKRTRFTLASFDAHIRLGMMRNLGTNDISFWLAEFNQCKQNLRNYIDLQPELRSESNQQYKVNLVDHLDKFLVNLKSFFQSTATFPLTIEGAAMRDLNNFLEQMKKESNQCRAEVGDILKSAEKTLEEAKVATNAVSQNNLGAGFENFASDGSRVSVAYRRTSLVLVLVSVSITLSLDKLIFSSSTVPKLSLENTIQRSLVALPIILLAFAYWREASLRYKKSVELKQIATELRCLPAYVSVLGLEEKNSILVKKADEYFGKNLSSSLPSNETNNHFHIEMSNALKQIFNSIVDRVVVLRRENRL